MEWQFVEWTLNEESMTRSRHHILGTHLLKIGAVESADKIGLRILRLLGPQCCNPDCNISDFALPLNSWSLKVRLMILTGNSLCNFRILDLFDQLR